MKTEGRCSKITRLGSQIERLIRSARRVNDEHGIADRFDSAAHTLQFGRREGCRGNPEDAGSNDKCEKARHDVTPFVLPDVCMESFALSAGPSWLWANVCDTSKDEPIER